MARMSMRDVARRVADAGSRALRRTIADRWPLLQGTAAATAAWLLAKYVFDHPEPVFAPLAALIALNTSLGERGLNALRLLQGVILGIIMGELALAALAGGYGSMAMAILRCDGPRAALGGSRIAVAQAAAGAIITVAGTDAEAGVERLSDALIGAGVALVFSQVLFSPEPIALIRRAEAAVLERIAAGLKLSARALEQDDDALAQQAIDALRELPDDVTELRRSRRASARVARRTLAWRSRRALVVHESENATYLDLLGGSCLLLARFAATLDIVGATRRRAERARPRRHCRDAGRRARRPGHPAACRRTRAGDRQQMRPVTRPRPIRRLPTRSWAYASSRRTSWSLPASTQPTPSTRFGMESSSGASRPRRQAVPGGSGGSGGASPATVVEAHSRTAVVR